MNRKEFITKATLTGAGMSLLKQGVFAIPPKRNNGKILNAYYFRGHMYTMVPRHVREDLKWMADVGTNAVSLAILEQDLFAAVENIDIICNEAEKLGMKVWGVPSRWAGLLAGAPKVPSLFSIQNHHTWTKNKDGSYASSSVSGRISSIFHPATLEFMVETSLKMLKTWNLTGIMWDEPKSLGPDYHELALKKLGKNPSITDFIRANAEFYSTLNTEIKSAFPSTQIGMFVYANTNTQTLNQCAGIKNLDDFGCDGRPWGLADGGKQESKGKVLLGGVGQKFINAAKQNNKRSLWLIENHNMSDKDIPILEKRMPEIVNTDVDHLIYYYYPRNLSKPDKIMNIIKKNIINY